MLSFCWSESSNLQKSIQQNVLLLWDIVKRQKSSLLPAILILFLLPIRSQAQSKDEVRVSPYEGWEQLPPFEAEEPSITYQILTWIPNRVLDLLDVFRFDVGAGPAVGASVSITRSFQAGYRDFFPGSVRVGNFGRTYPWMYEDSPEHGLTPWYKQSSDRNLCPYQLSLGVDVLLVGAHLGFCPTGFFDFLGGLVLLDPQFDDL